MSFTPGANLWTVTIALFIIAACDDSALDSTKAPDKSCPTCPKCPEPGPIRVVVIGDRTGHPDDRVFRETLREAARLKPDMLISIGDLIEGYQSEALMAEAEAEWDSVLKTIRSVTGNIPLYATPGNHDVWSAASQALFEKELQHRVNMAFDVGSTRIILLDTSRVGSEKEIPEETLDWLWHALRAARDKKKRIVITHKPLWAIDPGGKYGSPLHDVLIAGNADSVIAGHWHHTMADIRDDIQYQLIGPTGASPNHPGHPESGNFQQFGLLVIDAEGAELSLVKSESILPSDAISYSTHQLEWRIVKRGIEADGFALDAISPQETGILRLVVTNVTEAPMKSRLSFRKEGDWRVVPASSPIDLAPGESSHVRFSFSRRAHTRLFPGPSVALAFPWPEGDAADGGEYLLDKQLDPTLVRRVPAFKTAPTIDGDLSDAAWRRAALLGELGEQRGDPIPGSTQIRVVIVGSRLFIAAVMGEPDMQGQTREITGRDRFVEDEDHVVFFIDTDPEVRGYAKIALNAAGAVFDRMVAIGSSEEEELAWNGITESAVARSGNEWRVELAIPLDAVGWDGQNRRIGFNFWRGRVRDHEVSHLYWQPLQEQDGDSFGILVLPE